MWYTVLWWGLGGIGYVVGGYFLHSLIVPLLSPTPFPLPTEWVQKNWWVRWMDSWGELDSLTNPDGTIRNHVPFKNPVLQKLQIPLQLLFWPLDLLLTLIGKFTS